MKIQEIRRRFFSAIVLLLLLFSSAWGADGRLVLLSLNDIHGRIYSVDGVGGLAKAATAVSALRKENPGNTFLLQIGDVNEGPLFYYFHGNAEMRGLSLMKTDVGTLGNHEFDLGEDVLFEARSYARFPIVVSNLRRKDGTPAPFPQYIIKEAANGMKVGFFGLLTPELGAMTGGSQSFRAGQDLPSEAERMVTILNKEGCDAVVLLSHCGLDVDREIARSAKGITAILGGHSHTLMEKGEFVTGPDGWTTLIGQAGSYARHLGVMTLDVREKEAAPSSEWRVKPLSKEIPEDPAVLFLLEPFRKKLDAQLGAPLAPQPADMDARRDILRRGETPLGNFLADAFRWKAKSQVAFLAGGSIRGDQIYPAGSVSYATLTNMMPFGGSLYRGTLTGADLLQVLETSASAYEMEGDGYDAAFRTPTGGFLQVSGVRFVLNPRKQPRLTDNNGVVRTEGSRILRAEILQPDGTWSPLKPDELYTVATTDWTAGGGDKYSVLKKNASAFSSMEQMYLESAAEYIRFLGEMNAQTEGRITITE